MSLLKPYFKLPERFSLEVNQVPQVERNVMLQHSQEFTSAPQCSMKPQSLFWL